MKFVLVCDCGSTDFEFDHQHDKFICNDCGLEYNTEDAGHELLGEANDHEVEWEDDDEAYSEFVDV